MRVWSDVAMVRMEVKAVVSISNERWLSTIWAACSLILVPLFYRACKSLQEFVRQVLEPGSLVSDKHLVSISGKCFKV